MSPFTVIFRAVPDAALGPLMTEAASLDLPPPEVEPLQGAPLESSSADAKDIPSEWSVVREYKGTSYQWPDYRETYNLYTAYSAETRREGVVVIALGEAERTNTWGKNRKYVIAFLSGGKPQIPLVEFLETDDYPATGELLAIIRGKGGGRKMFGPADSLPEVYSKHFRVETYSDRIGYSGAWNKAAVIAHKEDVTTILNHALLQARRRGDL